PSTSHNSRRSFYFLFHGDHRYLHSFPTRRSSDLELFFCGNKSSFLKEYPKCLGMEWIGMTYHPIHIKNSAFILYHATKIHDIPRDRKSTRLNSSHVKISYAVFCLKKKILQPLTTD